MMSDQNSFALRGYFTKVVESKGQIVALFTTKQGSNIPNYYLYLPEREILIGKTAFKNRLAIYETHFHNQNLLVVSARAETGKTNTGLPKIEVTSVKEYAQVKREKAVEILKENFEKKEITTLEALHIEAKERIAIIEATEEAEKKWLLNISGHAGEEAYFDRKDFGTTKFFFFILGKNKVVFHADSREKLYKEIIEYGEARRQGTVKQSLLCKKYKEGNDE